MTQAKEGDRVSLGIEHLTYGEIKKLVGLLSEHEAPNTRLAGDGEIRIAVLQRGHVVVGEYSQKGHIGTLTNASVIRKWGTANGLGELAEKGPLADTVLDACPSISFHVREVIFIMEVNNNAWRNHDNE